MGFNAPVKIKDSTDGFPMMRKKVAINCRRNCLLLKRQWNKKKQRIEKNKKAKKKGMNKNNRL